MEGVLNEDNAHIVLLADSDDDDVLPSEFTTNTFFLPADDNVDEVADDDDSNVQYQYIDQDGKVFSTNVQLKKFCSLSKNVSEENISKFPHVGDVKIGWTKPMVKCLINCYRELILEFRNPVKKQKDVWSKASAMMKQNGYNVTWSHCDRKWRNLKHTFKKYYYSKNKNRNMNWEFYDDLLILFAQDCRHEYKEKQRMSRVILPPASGDDSESNSSLGDRRFGGDGDNCRQSESEGVESGGPPKWFTDYMQQFEIRQEDMMHQFEIRQKNMMVQFKDMQESSLRVERQKCEALEALLNKFSNNEK